MVESNHPVTTGHRLRWSDGSAWSLCRSCRYFCSIWR
jgi:hypothetical protein